MTLMILMDTTKSVIERWEDPGDYPNAVASGALPSYDYVAAISGEIRVEMGRNDYEEFLDNVECDVLSRWVVELLGYKYPTGVLSAKWGYNASGGERYGFLWLFHKPVFITLWVEEVESDPDYRIEGLEDG
jgi:hypothetical protein